MQINENLKNYILILDNVFPEKTLSNFYRICKESNQFIDAGVVDLKGNSKINKKERKTFIWPMHNTSSKSLTESHWANYLSFNFYRAFEEYRKRIIVPDVNITDIQILKYTEGGFYLFHVDDGPTIPRTLSFIYFINDEYEGGELVFNFNNSGEDYVIEKKKNRMIVWPSNFLYRHSVKPTKKGIRYSVVAWAR